MNIPFPKIIINTDVQGYSYMGSLYFEIPKVLQGQHSRMLYMGARDQCVPQGDSAEEARQ